MEAPAAFNAVLFSILLLSPSVFLVYQTRGAGTEVSEFATGLEAPWSMAFTPDGRMFVTERPGRIRTIVNGVLSPDPVAIVNVAHNGEAGLLGLTIDPDFPVNKRIYVYYTDSQLKNRVSVFTESTSGPLIEAASPLINDIAGASNHDGGRLAIGPDKKLYITTGDASNSSSAQDLNSPNGKILRLELNGSIPLDNPISGSPVYSLGHRNPQGITWDQQNHMLETEHGQSANDEVNLIQAGQNYGWPIVQAIPHDARFVDPVTTSGSFTTWAPSGTVFYSSNKIPEWTGRMLIATLRGEHVRILGLNFSQGTLVVSSESILQGVYGRLRDIIQGPDGYVYLATSNRDGRGTIRPSDDKILRISSSSGLPPGGLTLEQIILLYALVVAAIVFAGIVAFWQYRKRYRPTRNSKAQAASSTV